MDIKNLSISVFEAGLNFLGKIEERLGESIGKDLYKVHNSLKHSFTDMLNYWDTVTHVEITIKDMHERQQQYISKSQISLPVNEHSRNAPSVSDTLDPKRKCNSEDNYEEIEGLCSMLRYSKHLLFKQPTLENDYDSISSRIEQKMGIVEDPPVPTDNTGYLPIFPNKESEKMETSPTAYIRVTKVSLTVNKQTLGDRYCCLAAGKLLLGAELNDQPAEYVIQLIKCSKFEKESTHIVNVINTEGDMKYSLTFPFTEERDKWKNLLDNNRDAYYTYPNLKLNANNATQQKQQFGRDNSQNGECNLTDVIDPNECYSEINFITGTGIMESNRNLNSKQPTLENDYDSISSRIGQKMGSVEDPPVPTDNTGYLPIFPNKESEKMETSPTAYIRVTKVSLTVNKQTLGDRYCCLAAGKLLLGAELNDQPAEYVIQLIKCSKFEKESTHIVNVINTEGDMKYSLTFPFTEERDKWKNLLDNNRDAYYTYPNLKLNANNATQQKQQFGRDNSGECNFTDVFDPNECYSEINFITGTGIMESNRNLSSITSSNIENKVNDGYASINYETAEKWFSIILEVNNQNLGEKYCYFHMQTLYIGSGLTAQQAEYRVLLEDCTIVMESKRSIKLIEKEGSEYSLTFKFTEERDKWQGLLASNESQYSYPTVCFSKNYSPKSSINDPSESLKPTEEREHEIIPYEEVGISQTLEDTLVNEPKDDETEDRLLSNNKCENLLLYYVKEKFIENKDFLKVAKVKVTVNKAKLGYKFSCLSSDVILIKNEMGGSDNFIIELNKCQVEKESKYILKLSQGDLKYYFTYNSSEERDEWKDQLESNCQIKKIKNIQFKNSPSIESEKEIDSNSSQCKSLGEVDFTSQLNVKAIKESLELVSPMRSPEILLSLTPEIISNSEEVYLQVCKVKLSVDKKDLGWKFCCFKYDSASSPILLLGSEMDNMPAEYTLKLKNCTLSWRKISKNVVKIVQGDVKFRLNFETHSNRDIWRKLLNTDNHNSKNMERDNSLLILAEMKETNKNVIKNTLANLKIPKSSSFDVKAPVTDISSNKNVHKKNSVSIDESKVDRKRLINSFSHPHNQSSNEGYERERKVSELISKFEGKK